MAEKILKVTQNYEKLYLDYCVKMRELDYYGSQLLYNRIKQFNDPEVVMGQAGMYARLDNLTYEVDALIKLLTFKKYTEYNPKAVLAGVCLYFSMYSREDVSKHYIKLIESRFAKQNKKIKLEIAKPKDLKSPIHIVEDDDTKPIKSDNVLKDAMQLLDKDKTDEAMHLLLSVDKSDPEYTRAMNLASIVYAITDRAKESKDLILELIKEGKADKDSFVTLYKVTDGDAEGRTLLTEELRNADPSDSTKLLLHTLDMDNGNYTEALNDLKEVSEKNRYSESYLTLYVNCVLKCGLEEETLEALKKLYTIYPNNPLARFMALEYTRGNGFPEIDLTTNKISRKIKNALTKEVKDKLKTKDFIKTATIEELQYLLNLAKYLKDYELIKELSKEILKTKYKGLVLDQCISVTTSIEALQVIMQAIIETKEIQDFWVLKNDELREIHVYLPTLFKEAIEPKAKYETLLLVFAQSYSMSYLFADFNPEPSKEKDAIIKCTKQIEKFEKILRSICNTNLEDYPVLTNLDYMIYTVCYYINDDKDLINQIFSWVDEPARQDVYNYLETIKNEL